MKSTKITYISILIILIAVSTVPVHSLLDGQRNQVYLLFGAGAATKELGGIQLEMGVEARLFGPVHARLLLDYNGGGQYGQDNEAILHSYGVNLYAIYKLELSETVSLRLKGGGQYTTVKGRTTVYGITLDTLQTDLGLCGGTGLAWQFGNRLWLFTEAEIKYLFSDTPRIWGNIQLGLFIRLR